MFCELILGTQTVLTCKFKSMLSNFSSSKNILYFLELTFINLPQVLEQNYMVVDISIVLALNVLYKFDKGKGKWCLLH